ncbi:DUF4230 domain-containing protein [Paenisporosarcina cavernae]|uniref:DUF4230 domain-containing protein n=1 Tax=Paenisporosarcina cavernae TaxID=2320858 RepID=A0A385YT66_9BACL|nr:DUF4230 domain-containing protein [Paenisporosarcina cavernae]AYC28772.1 DUF4230 domain-containing protein [Paenisporosarcina cavernae]
MSKKIGWGIVGFLLAVAIFVPLVLREFKIDSQMTESKSVFIEQIKGLNELSTVEVFSKAVIKREDTKSFFGNELPGTKRQLLFVIPGTVRAGIDLTNVNEGDITLNDEKKEATLTLPKAEFLGKPSLDFDKRQIFSHEEIFREKADLDEAFDLAEEAEQIIMEEATSQGILELAEENAEKSIQSMFRLVDYNVKVVFEEE